MAKRPGWSSLAAVKDGHVIPLNDDIASRWGPRIVDLLRTVAARDQAGQRVTSRSRAVPAAQPSRSSRPCQPGRRGCTERRRPGRGPPGGRRTPGPDVAARPGWPPRPGGPARDADRRRGPATAIPPGRVRPGRSPVAAAALLAALTVGVSVGPGRPVPADGRPGAADRGCPGIRPCPCPPIDSAIVWQIRLPRVRPRRAGRRHAGRRRRRLPGRVPQPARRSRTCSAWPRAAAWAPPMIIINGGSQACSRAAAFAGAAAAVAITYLLGAARRRGGSTRPAGPHRVDRAGRRRGRRAAHRRADLPAAGSTRRRCQQIYSWILGSLSTASWSDMP